MTTPQEHIEELIAAGEKATQGNFTLEKVKPDDGFDDCLMSFGGSLKLDNYSYSVWQTIKEKDARFIVEAANARPAIKTMLAANKSQANFINEIRPQIQAIDRQNTDLQENNTRLVLENRKIKDELELAHKEIQFWANLAGDEAVIKMNCKQRIAFLEKQLEDKNYEH